MVGSSNKSHKEEATCDLDVILVTHLVGSNNTTNHTITKRLEDSKAVFQVGRKDLYFGSSYRIKWNQVKGLEVRRRRQRRGATNAYDDDDDDDDDDEQDDASASFVLETDQYHFEAMIADLYSRQGAARQSSWKDCCDLLEKYWNKKLKKEQRQLDAQQQQEQQQNQSSSMGGNRRNYGTYSQRSKKKQSKASRFLSKNLQNMKEWDSDDDQVFNRLPPKALKQQQQQQPKQEDDTKYVQREEEDEENEHDQTETVKKETQKETSLQDADEHQNVEMEDGNHGDMALEANDGGDDTVGEEDPPAKQTKRRRLKRKSRKRIDDNDSDDEDFLFQNDDNDIQETTTTTPRKEKRIVSPATTKNYPPTRQCVFDDDDDDDDDEEKKEMDPPVPAHSIKSSSPIKKKNTPSSSTLSRFFVPKQVTPAPPSSPEEAPELSEEQTHKDAPVKKKSGPAPRDFFAPRRPTTTTTKISSTLGISPKLQKGQKTTKESKPLEESSDDTTVIPSATDDDEELEDTKTSPGPVMTPRSIFKNNKKAPNPTSASSFACYESAKQIEEDDPIVDEDTPSRSSSSRPLPSMSFKKRLFNGRHYGRTPPSTTKTQVASMALEFADTVPSPQRPRLVATDTTKTTTSANKKQKTSLTSPTATTSRSPPLSPCRTSLPNFRGLRNLGNTCYMNSSLQMLYSVPLFLQALVEQKLPPPNDSDQQEPKKRKLISSLSNIWKDLTDRSYEGGVVPSTAVNPRSLKLVMDSLTNKFLGYQQRDAHEFLGDLLDQIHEESEQQQQQTPETETQNMLPTDDFFRLNVEVCLQCKSCGYSRTKEEMYRYLSIDIADDAKDNDGKNIRPTVEMCLAQFFKPEDREIKCEKCEDGTVATQTMRILSRPKALLLHLKRFVVVEKKPASPESNNNGVEMIFCKKKAAVQLDDQLSLSRYLAADKKGNNDDGGDQTNMDVDDDNAGNPYELKSIVHHIGSSADSGHYTSDAVREHPETHQPTWVSFDDGVVTETDYLAIRSSISKQKTAYMLLYSTT